MFKDNPVKSAKIVGPGAIGFTAFMMSVSTALIGTSLGKTIGITDLNHFIIAISAGLIIIVFSYV